MINTMRDLAKGIDRACARLNDSLITMTIVLAVLIVLTAVYRAAEVFWVPEGFANVATT
jgi:hypothetical protein